MKNSSYPCENCPYRNSCPLTTKNEGECPYKDGEGGY